MATEPKVTVLLVGLARDPSLVHLLLQLTVEMNAKGIAVLYPPNVGLIRDLHRYRTRWICTSTRLPLRAQPCQIEHPR